MTITISDPNNLLTASEKSAIQVDLNYVAGVFSTYIAFKSPLTMQMTVLESGSGQTDNGLASDPDYIDYNGQATLAAIVKGATGVDPVPGQPDGGFHMFVTSTGQILNYGSPLWFDPDPQIGVNPTLPNGMQDFVSIATHELTHALGFAVGAAPDPNAPSSELPWTQHLVEQNGVWYYSSPAITALVGGNLPVDPQEYPGRPGDHLGNTSINYEPVLSDLMYEWGNYANNRWQIGQIDLTILHDLGYTIQNYQNLALTDPLDYNDIDDSNTTTNITITANLGGSAIIKCGSGNDTVSIFNVPHEGNQFIIGGSGFDTVTINDTAQNYKIIPYGTDYLLQCPSGIQGVSLLRSISDVKFSDTTELLDVKVSAAASDAGQSNVSAIFVSDSAADVASGLNSLQALVSKGVLSAITLTDSGTPTMTVTAAQLTADGSALGEIQGPYSLTVSGVTAANAATVAGEAHVTSVTVSDTAATVLADAASIAGMSFVTSVIVSDTVADILANHSALQTSAIQSELSSFAIDDSAADIAANLASLSSLAAATTLGSIILTDKSAPNFSLSAAELTANLPVFDDIISPYTISVTDGAKPSFSLTAAQLSASLSVFNNITGPVTVSLTGSAAPTLSITSAQASNDTTALNDISGNFSVAQTAGSGNQSISGVAAALGNSVLFNGAASQYSITPSGDGIHFTVATGGNSDQLSNIQALQFSDYTEIVAPNPGSGGAVTGGNITELYGAVFGRVPDVDGLNFYEKALAANPNLSLTTLAEYFLSSPEYKGNTAHNYLQTPAGDAQFIDDCYTNLLNRAPDSGDVPYYQKVISQFTQGLTPGTAAYAAAESQGHALVLVYFSASPEFLSDVQVTAANPASAGFHGHWLVLI